jgi:hypothetical protein
MPDISILKSAASAATLIGQLLRTAPIHELERTTRKDCPQVRKYRR